jgi:hypothetical protein
MLARALSHSYKSMSVANLGRSFSSLNDVFVKEIPSSKKTITENNFESYKSHLGYLIVPENQKYIVYDPLTGKNNIITGPKSKVFFSNRKVKQVDSSHIPIGKSVQIWKHDGSKQTKQGPCFFHITPDIAKYSIVDDIIIQDGQIGIVYTHDGKHDLCDGPTTISTDFDIKKVDIIKKCIVNENQYVRVTYNDMKFIDNIKDPIDIINNIVIEKVIEGPCTFVCDPSVKHFDIHDKIQAKNDEYIHIVYKNGTEEIKEGPLAMIRDFNMESVNVYKIPSASVNQYLKIQYKDGMEQIKHGPVSATYTSDIKDISTYDGIDLDGQEALIIYTAKHSNSQSQSEQITREIVRGPITWMPEATDVEGNHIRQWTHQFSVHGNTNKDAYSDANEIQIKVPGGLNFQKLRLVPSMMYVDTIDSRTKDDALLTIKSVVYYQIDDIECLLDNTFDFTADLINALSSCTNTFVNNHSFDSFKEDIYLLNGLENYTTLTKLAEKIGISVTNVVCNGYIAPRDIQVMQEKSLETHTRLNLERDEEHQKQELMDYKLKKETDRSNQEMELEKKQKTHELDMKQNTHDMELTKDRAMNDERMRIEEHETRQMKERSTVIDLTAVEVAKNTPAPSSRYEFVNAPKGAIKNELKIDD